ncbi:MAG: uncharacterized protein A8A55_1108 [Amphiamblys sp. WSBS2006]|nr:MAG: uncharacterized protein A8A55_1108 [Amphiamblys sp. WSBS2006]
MDSFAKEKKIGTKTEFYLSSFLFSFAWVFYLLLSEKNRSRAMSSGVVCGVGFFWAFAMSALHFLMWASLALVLLSDREVNIGEHAKKLAEGMWSFKEYTWGDKLWFSVMFASIDFFLIANSVLFIVISGNAYRHFQGVAGSEEAKTKSSV